VRRDWSGAPLEPRDVETEPLLEPEYVMVRFEPRSNNRRLVLYENRGLHVDLRIEAPVPGEFPEDEEEEEEEEEEDDSYLLDLNDAGSDSCNSTFSACSF
jgi:hypothetical protein